MKIFVVAATAFILGCVTYHFIAGNSPPSIQQHWATFERHNAEMRKPENEEVIDGMVAVNVETDPVPALMALASAGEIEHVDLVFPNVTNIREANLYWIPFVNKHDDILYVEGNPSSVVYKTTGKQPLHLNIWFRKSARGRIQELIQELELLANADVSLEGILSTDGTDEP